MPINVINKLTLLDKYEIYNILNQNGAFNYRSIKKSYKNIRKHV